MSKHYFTFFYVAIMLFFFFRDLFRFQLIQGKIERFKGFLKNLKDDEIKDVPEELSSFFSYLENGWIKNVNDLEYLISKLKDLLYPSIVPSKFIMAGLLGTFLGLMFGFYSLKNPINNIENYISSLFTSCSLAFISSIFGIVFFFFTEICLKKFEDLFTNFSYELRWYVVNNFGPVEVSIRKMVEPIKSLVNGLTNLSNNFEPIINSLATSIKNFDNSIEKYDEINNQYRQVSESLKNSIKDLHSEYVTILDFMHKSTLEKEEMLSLIKSLEEFSRHTNSIATSINSLIEQIQIIKDIPVEFKNNMNNLLKLEEENNKILTSSISGFIKDFDSKIDKFFVEQNDNLSKKFIELASLLKNLETIKEYNAYYVEYTQKLVEYVQRLEADVIQRLDSVDEKFNSVTKIDNILYAIEEKMPSKISDSIKNVFDGKVIEEIKTIKDLLTDVVNTRKNQQEIPISNLLDKLDQINQSIQKKRFSIFGG